MTLGSSTPRAACPARRLRDVDYHLSLVVKSGDTVTEPVVRNANSAIAFLHVEGRMKRREFLGMLAGGRFGVAGLCLRTAKSGSKAGRFVGQSAASTTCKGFARKLQALGWVEGKNLIIEYRYGEGRDERFPEFAAELVSMPVDVLVVWGSPAAFAAKHATTTISILIGAAGDVVNTGLVSNLSAARRQYHRVHRAERRSGRQAPRIAEGGDTGSCSGRRAGQFRQSTEPVSM